MRLRVLAVFVFLSGSAIGLLRSATSSHDSDDRFEAHEFAVFRSEYESLRVQSPQRRADHFRDLLETMETSRVTPGMNEALAGFCQTVVASEAEPALVKAEASRVLRALGRGADRSPASLEKPK